MTDEDHDARKTPESLAPGYHVGYVETRRDGTFPVVVEYGDDGAPVSIRIDLRGRAVSRRWAPGQRIPPPSLGASGRL